MKPLVSSAPAHSILQAQGFRYVPAAQTDIRKTFARARNRLARASAAVDANSNVKPLLRRKA